MLRHHRPSSWIFVLLICLGAASCGTIRRDAAPKAPPPTSPNVVIIFADDLGYADVGCYGAQAIKTPNIDRLAREGVRFTDFYVAQPVCSSSRAALLTGCYPNRIGIHGALGPSSKNGIHPDEITLGELCKSKGYRTALYGKWHLGHHPPFLPTRHGFDDFYGIPYSNDMWPYHPESPKAWVDLPTIEDETAIGFNTDQKRFTTDFTNRAVKFIEDTAGKSPFFVYLAHPMPHVPLHVSRKFQGTSSGLYGDVIQEIDWSVGQVLAALSRTGVDKETLVIFTSDNGPWLSYGNHAGSTGPLREGKGTTFEGGIRVPCVMRWPGKIPRNRVCREPTITLDIFPTVAGLIDATLPAHPIDGKDIWPLMQGKKGATSPHQALFFYYHRGELQGMRSGRWKLHFPHKYRSMEGREMGRDGVPGKYDYSQAVGLALFDLIDDVGEKKDLSGEYPEVVKKLQGFANEMRGRIGDTRLEVNGTEVRPAGEK